VTARTAEGRIVRAWDYKQKRNLVIAFLHSDCPRCVEWLAQLAARAAALSERAAGDLGAGRSLPAESGILRGKISYMPPEQIQGKEIDHRADIFALGVVFYELITGSKPFDARSDVTVVQAILLHCRAGEPPAPRKS